MPTKKTYKRKATRRRRGAKRLTVSVSRSSPIPDRYVTRMKYSAYHTLTTSTIPVGELYRVNSTFDPLWAVGGHQPLGYDQLSALYSSVRDFGCKYKVTFRSNSAAPLHVGVESGPETTLSTLWSTIEERAHAKTHLLGVLGTSKDCWSVSGYASAAQVLGVTKERYRTDDQYAHAFGANPAVAGFLKIIIDSPNGTGFQCNVEVQLEYYSTWYERIPLTQS